MQPSFRSFCGRPVRNHIVMDVCKKGPMQYLVPRNVKRLRTPKCSVPSAPTVTDTFDRVACPHAGQNTLLWDLQTLPQPSHRSTDRCSEVICAPPLDTSRRPIWIATFCTNSETFTRRPSASSAQPCLHSVLHLRFLPTHIRHRRRTPGEYENYVM